MAAHEITAPQSPDVCRLRDEDLPKARELARGNHRTPFVDPDVDGPDRFDDANVQVVLARGRVVGVGWAEFAGDGAVVIGGLAGPPSKVPAVLAQWAQWAQSVQDDWTFYAEADGELRVVADGELYWLDRQHLGYRFEPDRVGRPGQPPWSGAVYPDGDYYLYVPGDLRFGTFGHPWEHTLCVFGESLVAHVEQRLNGLMGPPVRRS